MINWLYFVLSLIVVCLAHFIRVYRWSLFIKVYEKPKFKSLVQSLSLGYLLNYILPYKLGEFARAWVSGKKMDNGKALGFSTVIVDRFLDIVCVGCIFTIMYLLGIGDSSSGHSAVLYIGVAGALLAVALIAYLLKGVVKRGLLLFAGIFNNNIEMKLLRLFWSLIWNFKDIFLKINKFKLIATTVVMWIGYVLSY